MSMPGSGDYSFISLEETADLLGVDATTVVERIEAGELQAIHLDDEWRISTRHLVDYLRRESDVERKRSIEDLMRDPQRLAGELLNYPDCQQQIESETYEIGTVGDFLQRGLRAIESE